jgi:hypothetical protein
MKADRCNELDRQKTKAKVPWEPWKAATNSTSTNKTASSPAIMPNELENSSGLIKYKISTDLDAFNMSRPGYQFDDIDLKSIQDSNSLFTLALTKKVMNDDNSSSPSSPSAVTELMSSQAARQPNFHDPNFQDARLYSDVHFFKLANQLRKKCVDPSSNISSSPPVAKPVNVVGPMIEKKKNVGVSGSGPGEPGNPYGADNNSIKLWKSQQTQYESEIKYLKTQICGINEQLQIQTQVNVELKKLLVASIGSEDLQYKIERLVNDKLRYEIELASNTKLIERLSDDIEQVCILV